MNVGAPAIAEFSYTVTLIARVRCPAAPTALGQMTMPSHALQAPHSAPALTRESAAARAAPSLSPIAFGNGDML